MAQNVYHNTFFPNAHQPLIAGGSFVIHNTIGKSAYERLLEAAAPNAHYDSGHTFDRPKCHPGTRVAVMQVIYDWVAGANEESCDKGINWVSGAAGAGKSAIGRSICELCARTGMLLASFFFGSRDPTRNHSKSLVATLAYQICTTNPAIREEICGFVNHDPLIFTKSLKTQFECLIMTPMAKVYGHNLTNEPLLIVIDGLDECLDQADQRDILHTLLHIITSYPSIPIRFLVLSRPESNITNILNGVQMRSTVFKIFLGDEYDPDADIELYLSERLEAVRENHNFKHLIPSSWPTRDHINQLVYKSSGQFIYASTAVLYVESPRHQPHQRLEVILGLRPPFKDLPFAELDALYTQVISMTENPNLAINILAFPALYGVGFYASDIGKYLALEDGEVDVMVSDLAAIVSFHLNDDNHMDEIVLHHKSFADFLFDAYRSNDLSLDYADTRASHILRSIEIFSELRGVLYFTGLNSCEYSLGSPFGTHCDDIERTLRECNKSLKMDILGALTSFPVRSFSGEVLSQVQGLESGEEEFLYLFFKVLAELEKQDTTAATGIVFEEHIRSFCECALAHFNRKNFDNLEMNFAFTSLHLKPLGTTLLFSHDFTPDLHVGTYLTDKQHPHNVSHTFRSLLTEGKKGQIIAKAATYCLECVCNTIPIKLEARRLLDIGRNRKKRNRLPRRMFRNPLFFVFTPRREMAKRTKPPFNISTWKKIYRGVRSSPDGHAYHTILPIHSTKSEIQSFRDHSSSDVGWTSYMWAMDYLGQILPLAGRYDKLIRFCKTKVFAPLSIMFPGPSRRARQEMSKYLERMEAEQ